MARYSPFPPYDLEEALVIAQTIWQQNAGKPMRRLTIFDSLERSPDSSASRSLITASSGYALTQGGYTAELISLTDRGRAIAERDDPQSKLDAVLGVQIFSEFFNNYSNSTLPSTSAALDYLKTLELTDQPAQNCLDILLKCGEQVELIQEFSGTKRVVSPQHAFETLSTKLGIQPQKPNAGMTDSDLHATPVFPPASDLAMNSTPPSTNLLPTVHIDIQIHIASDAKPEQIDQVFASMAKHLYKKE